jgi:hypothetical protein
VIELRVRVTVDALGREPARMREHDRRADRHLAVELLVERDRRGEIEHAVDQLSQSPSRPAISGFDASPR